MERLIKTGKITPKKSTDIPFSRVGIGFEKLDRGVFDPEKAYDKVCELGVKWVRIQSGWARTEKEKGKYEFKWLDSIIENLLQRGLVPWVCLCYGNGLYDERAAAVLGGVGCPPVFSDEQREAWIRYVRAVADRYKGRITHYEVWNEPDGIWCWKHGVNATELGELTLATAKAIKETDSDAKVIGGVVCDRKISYINEALKTGMGEYLDYISFHEYTPDETLVFERVDALRTLAKRYNPNIEIIQGESGSQSKSGGHGALNSGGWTEEIQAKQLARHTIADLMSGVEFTSYFSCLDMVEALHGTVGDVSSYLDYGYFGVLGAQFDENGVSVGTYYKKPSYFVLQNIASLFAGEIRACNIPSIFLPENSERIFGRDLKRRQVIAGGLSKEGANAFAYWYPSDIMTTSYQGTVSLEIYSEYDGIRLADVMDGSVYTIPESIAKRDEFGMYRIKNLPIKDTPLILLFGNF